MEPFIFPSRATGGVTLTLNVLGTPTLVYFKEDNPTPEKIENTRRSMEHLEIDRRHGFQRHYYG